MDSYDVAVIGSGPGGYVAAIRCAQLGKKVALIERYATLGGTCLNVGCIPSKALLDSSHHYDLLRRHGKDHGIQINGSFDFDIISMMKRKSSVVSKTVDGINYLMKKNKIDVHNGHGSFLDSNSILIQSDSGESTIHTKSAIIATGSKPNTLPFITIDKERIITSTEALSLDEIPRRLIIVGGGVIGLELGQVYLRLGAEVTVLEYADRILPSMDLSLSREMLKVLKKQGMIFHLSHSVNKVARNKEVVEIEAVDKSGKTVQFEADYSLVSVGRKPYTDNLGLDKIGVKTTSSGQIEIDQNLQTSSPNVYAIGDVIRGTMLAHKAEEEGILVAEYLSGQRPHIDYNLIPNVVYTWPEVASVGKTEQQLKLENIEYKKGQFPMSALGRSRASGDMDGLVKILSHKQTDEILGVHVIGARAADIIAEAVVAMEFRASAEDIARISHAHPTFTEAVKEAALATTESRPIHI